MDYLDQLKIQVEQLSKLLEDPQPGLTTWCSAYSARMTAITSMWLDTDPMEKWYRQYQPISNMIAGEERAWNNRMFETFGEELDYVLKINTSHPRHVWTWLEGDEDENGNNQFVVPGYHLVNRVGYFITSEPWTDEDQEIPMETERDDTNEESEEEIEADQV